MKKYIPMDFIGSRLNRMYNLLVEDSKEDDDDEDYSDQDVHIPCKPDILLFPTVFGRSLADLQGRPFLNNDLKLNSWTGPVNASCSDGVGDGVRVTPRTCTRGTTSSLRGL